MAADLRGWESRPGRDAADMPPVEVLLDAVPVTPPGDHLIRVQQGLHDIAIVEMVRRQVAAGERQPVADNVPCFLQA